MSGAITDIFLKNLINSTITQTGNPPRWVTMTLPDKKTNVSYFVIKNFSTNDSKTIQDGIGNGELVFDDKGNVSYQNFSFKNPAYVGNTTIDVSKTLNNIKKTSDLYEPQTNIVANSNMQYMLLKNGNTYNLIYNPIHGSTFGNLYKGIPPSNLSYGTEKGPPQLDALFKNYCNSVMYHDGNDSGYADPTCQCFINTEQNELNALYGGNATNYSSGLPSDSGALNFLKGTPTNHQAVCGAPGCRYPGIEDSSFLNKFISNNIGEATDCGDSGGREYIPFCSSYLSAAGNGKGELLVKDKVFYDRCANILKDFGQTYTCDSTDPKNLVCKPDPSGKFSSAQNCLQGCTASTGGTDLTWKCSGSSGGYTCYQPQGGGGDFSTKAECDTNCHKHSGKGWYFDTGTKKCTYNPSKLGVTFYGSEGECVDANIPYRCSSGRCIKYNDGDPGSSTDPKYTLDDCKEACGINYGCGSDGKCTTASGDNAHFTSSDCAKNPCTGPNVGTWKCGPDSNGYNQCTEVAKGTGQYPSKEMCESHCLFFKCSPSGQKQCQTPVFDGTANFGSQAACRNTCSRWKCVNNNCVQVTDGTGEYQTVEECRNACTPYKCNTSTGKCAKVSDGTGQYAFPQICQSDCKKSAGIMPLIIGLSAFGALIVIGLIVYFFLTRNSNARVGSRRM